MSQHAIYSPSSAKRWTNCTASAEAIAHLPEQEEGEAAQEGTAAHDEIDRILRHLNGKIATPSDITAALAQLDTDHPAAYGISLMLNYIAQLPAGRIYVEQRVELTPHIWGRADIQHWHEESATLTVPDYKNGYVGVDAEENEQLQIYAAASIYTHNLPAKWIRLVVVQPNDFRPVPRVKQWVTSADALFAFATRVAGIPKGPKEFKAGEHCRYCPLFGRCKPTSDLLANLSLAMQHEPGRVAPDQIAPFMVCRKPIEDYFKSLDKHATKLALGGAAVPGMKLVQTSKHRAWIDGDQARAMIFKHVGVEGLDVPTPAQAEKMKELPAGWIEKNTIRPDGGPALAFESDKRATFERKSGAEMFAAVTGGAK